MMRPVLLGSLLSALGGCLLPASADDGAAGDVVDDGLAAVASEGERAARPTRGNHLALGNPSQARADAAFPDNYLMVKPQYALSYNRGRGSANWVSWHLSAAWRGAAERRDRFTTDATLPSGWARVASSWYTASGFDRGHLCPSEDRDGSDADNTATFLMTNVVPQAPDNNQRTWKEIEETSRALVDAGNELYVIAGPGGVGGTGSGGGESDALHDGGVTVPAFLWKVIVVLPVGTRDVQRVSGSARIVAVRIPNAQGVHGSPWESYRTSVDALEQATGLDFLSSVPEDVQAELEATVGEAPAP